MAWPKIIEVAGVKVSVDSWDEVREAIEMLGREITVAPGEPQGETQPRRAAHVGGIHLNPTDRALLQQFIESELRGLLTVNLGHALGKRGKGIRPALESWSRRIGLVTEEGQTAFEPVKRFDGRGYRMRDHFIRAANDMLRR